MSSEELSLTWGDHHSTLVGVFEKLLETSTLVDCTIAAEGQYLRAHKVVLSACSPYFELLFTQENEKNPIVILKDVKFQELKSMIDFIYRGKVKIPEDRLEDFIDAAESLQIKGLGGGQKTNDSETKQSESQLTYTRRESHVSRKRRRLSVEDVENELSPKTDLNSESNSCESLATQQEPADVLSLSQSEIPSPIVTLTTGSDVISPDVQNEQSNEETNPSSMPVECRLSSTDTERLIAHAASVVKTEPEPDAEIFLDENECFVDPKKEVCVEEMTMLENDGISAVMEYVQQQQTTNQYSGAASTSAGPGRVPKTTSLPGAGNGTRDRAASSGLRVALLPPRGTFAKLGASIGHPSRRMMLGSARLGSSDAAYSGVSIRRSGSVVGRPHSKGTSGIGALGSTRLGSSQAAGSGYATEDSPQIVFASVGRVAGASSQPPSSRSAVGPLRELGSIGRCGGPTSATTTREGVPSVLRPGTQCIIVGADKRYASLLGSTKPKSRPKQHVCDVCRKPFGSPKDLRRHMRSHTFERPYVCEQCGKAYTQGHNLRKHNLKVHWNTN